MKPLSGTFAANALRHGIAGLNIEACRIGETKRVPGSAAKDRDAGPAKGAERGRQANTGGFDANIGRWPANLILDEESARLLDQAVGETRGGEFPANNRAGLGYHGGAKGLTGERAVLDSGGPSRFFFTSKVRPEERNLGGIDCRHPTLKPIDLCEYIARLILPPKRQDAPRRLLVPFAGAGSEMIGALEAGWEDVTGVELEEQSAEWARARIAAALSLNPAERTGKRNGAGEVLQPGLFDSPP